MTIQDTDPANLTYGQIADMVERIEQIPALSGESAPTTTTPAFHLGQKYIDTTTGDSYYCSEIPESGATGYVWNKVPTQSDLDDKQDTLTAGTNIQISSDNTISATNTTYTAGANIQILDNTISATNTTYTAGTNVSINSNNEISATDTTYSNFTGTNGTTAGTSGLVPAPAKTDANKFLKSDGSWGETSGIPANATLWGRKYSPVTNMVNGPVYSSMGTLSTLSSEEPGLYVFTNESSPIVVGLAHAFDSTGYNRGRIQFYGGSSGKGWRFIAGDTNVFGAYENKLDALNKKLVDLVDPTDAQDAATKNYVDTAVASAGSAFTNTEFNNILENA